LLARALLLLRILTLTSEVVNGWNALVVSFTGLLIVTPLMTVSNTGSVEPLVVIGVHSKDPLPFETVLIVPGMRTISAEALTFCLRVALAISSGSFMFELVHTWK